MSATFSSLRLVEIRVNNCAIPGGVPGTTVAASAGTSSSSSSACSSSSDGVRTSTGISSIRGPPFAFSAAISAARRRLCSSVFRSISASTVARRRRCCSIHVAISCVAIRRRSCATMAPRMSSASFSLPCSSASSAARRPRSQRLVAACRWTNARASLSCCVASSRIELGESHSSSRSTAPVSRIRASHEDAQRTVLIGAGVRAATAIMVCGERRAVCGERTCEFFRADGASSQRSEPTRRRRASMRGCRIERIDRELRRAVTNGRVLRDLRHGGSNAIEVVRMCARQPTRASFWARKAFCSTCLSSVAIFFSAEILTVHVCKY